MQIYVNKIKNSFVFKIKTGYKLELLFPKTMKLLGEDVPKLESVEVVLLHCNIVNNNYQQASKALFTFVQNKQFIQSINISPHSLTMLKWFTEQNSKQLEIEDNVNMTLIIE